jgi:L-talarate/galactarate dehydratase
MKITAIEAIPLRLPLPRPGARAGAQDPSPATTVDTVIVRLQTDSPLVGTGMTYSLDAGDAPLLTAIITAKIEPILKDEDPSRIEWLFAKAEAALAESGFAGLVRRAYAAVDFALWDLKGQAAGCPVQSLIGGYRGKLKAIVSDTATPALGTKQAVKETKALFDRGAAGVQIEVGTQDPDLDVERIRQLLAALPEGPWIEITAAGRYDLSSALWMGRVFEQEFAVDSYLDPVRPHDHAALTRLSTGLELSLAAGAYLERPDEFEPLLGVVSALRLDPVRLGGLTPARKIAFAAELRGVSIMPVRLPEVGVHLAGAVVWGRVCEYVDWFAELFTGGPTFESGQLIVPTSPGLGITINESVFNQWML